MAPGHTDLKKFDSRFNVEATKIKGLLSGYERAKKQLETEKKAYLDFSKQIDGYSKNPSLPGEFKTIVGSYS